MRAGEPGPPGGTLDRRTVLVVPCFQEAGRIDLPAFRRFLGESPDTDLLFVDDGSTDRTGTLLAEFVEEAGGRASLLRLEVNRGKGEAVRAGLLEALGGDPWAVGYWDADLATPLDAVDEFRGVLARRPDVDWVLGSRVRLLGRRIRRHPHRHYLGRAFATAASLVLGLPVYDTQCGAKMFRAGADLETLLANPFLSPWLFDVELLARLVRRCGARAAEERVVELPLREWRDVPGSKVRWSHGIRALRDLLRIRRRYRGGSAVRERTGTKAPLGG